MKLKVKKKISQTKKKKQTRMSFFVRSGLRDVGVPEKKTLCGSPRQTEEQEKEKEGLPKKSLGKDLN